MSAAKRTLRFTQGLGWGVLTLGTGTATVFLATATVGLAMTGIGIPLAFVTGAGTVGCGVLTGLCAERTGHNFYKAFAHDHHQHNGGTSVVYTNDYLDAQIQSNQMKGLGGNIKRSQLQQEVVEMSGSSKPLFVSVSNSKISKEQANSNTSSEVEQHSSTVRSIAAA